MNHFYVWLAQTEAQRPLATMLCLPVCSSHSPLSSWFFLTLRRWILQDVLLSPHLASTSASQAQANTAAQQQQQALAAQQQQQAQVWIVCWGLRRVCVWAKQVGKSATTEARQCIRVSHRVV